MVLEEKPVAGGGEEEESDDEAIDMEVISHNSLSLSLSGGFNLARFVGKVHCSGLC